jgi:YggT family protein
MTVIDLYLLLILVMVVLSFVAPGSYHPGAVLVRQLTDPLLAPIQRMMPSMGGLDFSPLIAGTALYILRDIVLPNLLA